MQRPNNNFASHNQFPSPPTNNKQRHLLKLSRKKRAAEASAAVIKAEQVNGFRGNDSLESLVKYIEGITGESLTTTKQYPIKEKELKSKKNRRKNVVGCAAKKGKSKKVVCLEEEPVSENGDCDLEIQSLPCPELSRRSCDDSDDGADTPIPVQSLMLFSPKSDEIYSPSSCSVDGADVENNNTKAGVHYLESVENYIHSISIEQEAKKSAASEENVCRKVAKSTSLLVNKLTESSVPYETGKKDARNTFIAQNSSANISCDKNSGFVIPVVDAVLKSQQNQNCVRSKELPVSQCCRSCHPSKVHVEFLDRIEQKNAVSSPPYDDSSDLKELSFGFDDFFPKNGSRTTDEYFTVNKQNSTSTKVPSERNVGVVKKEKSKLISGDDQRKFSSPFDRRNEKVRRTVKDFVDKRNFF